MPASSSQSCTKPFTIPQALASCDFFDNTVWGAPNLFGDASASGVARDFQAAATCDGTGIPEFASDAQLAGTMAYTGDLFNATLTVTINSISGTVAGVGFFIDSDMDGNLLTEALSFPTNAAGVYPFPFTIPASVGAVITISFHLLVGDLDNPGTQGAMNFNATLCQP